YGRIGSHLSFQVSLLLLLVNLAIRFWLAVGNWRSASYSGTQDGQSKHHSFIFAEPCDILHKLAPRPWSDRRTYRLVDVQTIPPLVMGTAAIRFGQEDTRLQGLATTKTLLKRVTW